MEYAKSVLARLWSVGTPLLVLGAALCFGSGAISGAFAKDQPDPPGFLKSLGWDNTVKLAGLALAVIGALILFFR